MSAHLYFNLTMTEPICDRELKIAELSVNLTDIPKSFLDKLSDRLISFLTPSEVRALYLEKPPLEFAPPALATALNISTISTLVSAAAAEITQRVPETFVKPVYTLGDGVLQAKDLETLRNFRKDGRGMGSLESSLEFYNSFLSGLKVGLNETENVKGLYTILPTECLSTLEQLKFRKATMPEVFSTLQTIHGSRKTLDELQSSIEIVMKNADNKPPLEVLSAMNNLLLKSSSNQIEMDATAIRETRRFLKGLGGETLWNAILAHFNTTPGRHFRDLLRILTEHFSETLSDLHSKVTKIRKIQVDQPTNPLSVNPVEPADRPVTISEIKRFLSIPDKTDISQGLCFTCGIAGHLMKDCKTKQRSTPGPNPPRRAPIPPNLSLPYHDQLCSVHPNGSHPNGTCIKQLQIACNVHGNAHSQSSCRMVGGGRGNKPPGGSQIGQKPRSNNNNRNSNWSNQPNPSPPPPTYHHPLNTLPPPQNVHNIQMAQSMIDQALALLRN